MRSAWNATFAARLEDLVSAFEIHAKVYLQAAQKETALRTAIAAMQRVAAAYRIDGDEDSVGAAETRLAELRQKLRGQ